MTASSNSTTTTPAVNSTMMRIALLLSLLSPHFVSSFTTTHPIQTHHNERPLLVRSAVVDPPLMPASDHQDDKRKKNDKDGDEGNGEIRSEEDEWTRVEGGFLPNILGRPFRRRGRRTKPSSTPSTSTAAAAVIRTEPPSSPATSPEKKKSPTTKSHPSILELTDIRSYKTHVVDEPTSLVVVRFYASWCKSCKASTPLFHSLASRHSSPDREGGGRGLPVKFAQVKLTKDTAYLQEGLGVPSVPYVHLYHPEGGLVEERKLSKGYYKEFGEVLDSYVAGSCDLVEEKEEEIAVEEEEEGVFE